MVEKHTHLRLLKNLITYGILILYVLIPMLDRMVCANCTDKVPFQGEATIGHLQAPPADAIHTSRDGTQSKTPGPSKHADKSFCSICANILMGIDVFVSHVHLSVARLDDLRAVPTLSELHYPIDKLPQNILV